MPNSPEHDPMVVGFISTYGVSIEAQNVSFIEVNGDECSMQRFVIIKS